MSTPVLGALGGKLAVQQAGGLADLDAGAPGLSRAVLLINPSPAFQRPASLAAVRDDPDEPGLHTRVRPGLIPIDGGCRRRQA